MTNPGWGSLETAAKVRDIIRKGVGKEIDRLGVDKRLIGRCVNVDLPGLKAQVWFPGDDSPTDVKLFSSVIPAAWEQKGFPSSATVASNHTNGFGGMVAVERFNESLYITDVLTGGTIQFQPQSVSSSISPVDSNGAPGNPHYTVLAVSTKQSANVPVGGSVTFGPFRRIKPNGTSPAGGLIRVIVENTNSDYTSAQTTNIGSSHLYEFNIAAYQQFSLGTELGTVSSDLGTFSSDPLAAIPRYTRLIPAQINQMYGSSSSWDDYDLEIGIARTVQGGSTTQAPTWEFWFRIVNRRFAAHDMDYKVTILSSALQSPLGIDNRFNTTVQTIADPVSGYAGFDEVKMGLFITEDSGWSFPSVVKDNFARVGTNGLGANYKTYTWDVGSALSTNNRAQLRLTAANQEVKADLARTFYGNDVYAEYAVSAVALGQTIKAGVKYNRSTSTSFFWAAIHLNVGGTVSYSINKRTAGTDTVLATGTVSYQGSGLTYNTNSRLAIHARYFPGGTHKVRIWDTAAGVEALADEYSFATDATYPGRNATTPTTAGLIVSQATGGTNTYPVDVYCYYFETRINPGSDEVNDQGYTYGNRFARWNTGPWRSSVLRQGDLLQRTITFSDTVVWNGTNLKWNGNILIGGIGRNRNGLVDGSAYISMPRSNTSNAFISTFSSDDGTPVLVDNTTGIPIGPGVGLWVGIKPGSRYQDLRPYLFLVNDFNTDRVPAFDLPEWAVLIAYRPVTGAYILLGNGDEIYPTAAVENGTWGLFAGITTEAAGAYANMGSPGSFTFTKLRTNTRLSVEMSGTFQTSVTTTGGQFGVAISGTDYDIASLAAPVAAANVHLPYAGKRILTGISALSAVTIQGRMKRLGGAGTITTDTADQVSINIREIP